MKFLLTVQLLLWLPPACAVSLGNGSPQDLPAATEKLERIIRDVEFRVAHPFWAFMLNPFFMNGDFRDIEDLLRNSWNRGIRFPPETLRDVSRRVIRLFPGAGRVEKRSIIGIVVHNDDSPEANAFVAGLLESEDPYVYSETLSALYHTRLTGDMVYEKLEQLYLEGKLTESRSLTLRLRINYSRALPEARSFLLKTNDSGSFRAVMNLLIYKNDLSGIPILFERYPDLNDVHILPNEEILITYLEASDGERFEKAIGPVFASTRVPELTLLKVLVLKLKSKDPSTRRIAARYIRRQADVRLGRMSREVYLLQAIAVLDPSLETIPDGEAKSEVASVLKELKEDLAERSNR